MALGTSRGRESEREMQDGTTDRMRMAFVLEDWDCVPMEVKRLAVFYCTHQLDTLADIAFFLFLATTHVSFWVRKKDT
jgi:hypothetical protein